jgi:hypothetical protein
LNRWLIQTTGWCMPVYLWPLQQIAMVRSLASVTLISLLVTGCNNDLEVNDEYKDNTIVFGVINQRDSVHLVKINKAFLGEGSALDMALVQDSSEYSDAAFTFAKVYRIDGSGVAVDSFPLNDTLITNRQPGTFYSPNQRLFYFVTPFVRRIPNTPTGSRMFLEQDHTYQLRLRVNGKDVTASTAITNDFTIQAQDLDTISQGTRVNLRASLGDAYASYSFDWTSRTDNKRFQVSCRMRYDEVTGTDTVRREFILPMGTQTSTYLNQEMAEQLEGETFFSNLSSFVRSNSNWASVNKRIFRGLDFLVAVANDDFHTYLTLTEPVSGIIEDRPAYSNINGGIGLWGSRYTKNAVGKHFNGPTLNELTGGQYTGDLFFCSPSDGVQCP